MFLILIYLGAVTLTTWALVDLAQTPSAHVRTLPKPLWALLMLVPYIGAVAWFGSGRSPVSSPARRGRAAAARSGRPLGPDDDPEFLRQLGRRRDHPE